MCKKLLFISFILLLASISSVSAAPFGLWEFNNVSDLTQATIGSDMAITGSITAAAGVDVNDGAALVSGGNYLTFTGMGNIGTWSMLIDFSVPASTIGNWQSLYQTDPNNSNDGECFIKSSDSTLGSGDSGYTTNSIVADTWYRMVVTFDYSTISYNLYIDGVNWRNTFASPGDGNENRWLLQNVMHLFADNDGEDPNAYISTAAFWDRELSPEEITSLGAAGTTIGELIKYKASAPSPAEGECIAFEDISGLALRWTAGDFAASHDVYFGTDFDDVNNATTASAEFMGNKTGANYIPTLSEEKTYFWRIDEVNGVDTWKGDVWSFVLPAIDDMKFWWKCDDGAGTVMTDSASGFNGALGVGMLWEDDTLVFSGNSGVTFDTTDVTTAFGDIDESVTITWWQRSHEFQGNNDIFVAKNVGDELLLRVHCPTASNHFMATMGLEDYVYYWEINNPEDERYISLKNTWHHFAVTKDTNAPVMSVYIDGELVVSTANRPNWGGSADGRPLTESMSGIVDFQFGNSPGARFIGALKDIRLYDRMLSNEEVDALTGDFPLFAQVVAPENGGVLAFESPNDLDTIELEWNAGRDMESHDVYFGTDFDDVNDATNASAEFIGNQAATTYAPTISSFGMYYWRIDEVDGGDVYKGEVWSFKVRDNGPILWYKFDETSGTTVVDSSPYGFDANSSHDASVWDATGGVDGNGCIDNDNIWRNQVVTVPSGAFATVDQEITVAFWTQLSHIFEEQTTLGGPWFTSNNISSKNVANKYFYTYAADSGYIASWVYGAKNPKDEWHHVTVTFKSGIVNVYYNGVSQWLSTPSPQPGTSIAGIDEFRLYSNGANWWDSFHGKMDDFKVYDRALTTSEIELFVGDRFKPASRPDPADGAEDVVLIGTELSWTAGQDAVSHQVYFSDDRIEVKNADVNSPCYKGDQAGESYNPGTLGLMKTYYWRVDEVDDEGILWKGDVWSFSSIQYIMVEDFESYDDEGNSITAVWDDKLGWGDLQISLQNDPCLSPINSMRLRYHVPYNPYHAIANRSFSPAQDWTVNGVKILTIHYYGDGGNFGLPAFVTIGDGTTDANVIVDVNTLAEGWNEINVSLPEIAAAGVDLNNVSYMEIGFGNGTNVGMSASKWDIVYIDDIALYPAKCVVSESSLDADITEDCVVNYDDLEALAFNWLLSGYTVSAAAVSDDDLVLHYDFENNVTDSVAGNNGTVQNLGSAISYDAGHNGGKCIHFNATATDSGSNMIVPPAAFASLEDEVTFSFWLKKDEAGPQWYQALFAGHGVAVDHREIFMSYAPAFETNLVTTFTAGSDGPIRWSSEDGISYTQEQPFDYTIWHHYAMVKNVKLGYMYIYADGELEAFSTGKFKPIAGCDTFRLGGYIDFESGENRGFAKASFDDFRVYDRALSHAEILTLAEQTTATVGLSELDEAAASDLNTDEAVNFADYSVLAGEWLVEDFWP